MVVHPSLTSYFFTIVTSSPIFSFNQQILCLDEIQTKKDQYEVNSCESHCRLTIAGKVLDKDDLPICLMIVLGFTSSGRIWFWGECKALTRGGVECSVSITFRPTYKQGGKVYKHKHKHNIYHQLVVSLALLDHISLAGKKDQVRLGCWPIHWKWFYNCQICVWSSFFFIQVFFFTRHIS